MPDAEQISDRLRQNTRAGSFVSLTLSLSRITLNTGEEGWFFCSGVAVENISFMYV